MNRRDLLKAATLTAAAPKAAPASGGMQLVPDYDYASAPPPKLVVMPAQRGARFVDDGQVASAGGLTSGIDLALHIVERHHGRDSARRTADCLEYQGQGWLDPSSNARHARPRKAERDACPVCGMDADRALKSVYRGEEYRFFSAEHEEEFAAAPERVLQGLAR